MVGVTLNFALSSIDHFFYYYISLVAVGIVALFEVLVIWLPDTPRSLLSRGYVGDAKMALKLLRGTGYGEELEEVKQRIITSRHGKKQPWRNLLKRSIFVPFLYLLMVLLVKQLCGFHAITAFAGEIFVKAGIANPRATTIYSTGIANVIGILAAFVTVDVVGRKPLLIVSGLLTASGTSMLGTFFYITRPSLCDNVSINGSSASGDLNETVNDCTSTFGPLAVVGLIIYNFGYSIGFGPIPLVLTSEFLPLSVRGKIVGTSTLFLFVLSTIVVGFYLQFVQLVTLWFAMWIFAVISVAGTVFVFVFIPETKGKSLETLEKRFEDHSCVLHIGCL